jgi:hypothetical protein
MQAFTAVPYTSMHPIGYVNGDSGIQPFWNPTTNPFCMYKAFDSLGTPCYGALVPWWTLPPGHPLMPGNSCPSVEDVFQQMAEETDDYDACRESALSFVAMTKREISAEQEMLHLAALHGWSQDLYRLKAKQNRKIRMESAGSTPCAKRGAADPAESAAKRHCFL